MVSNVSPPLTVFHHLVKLSKWCSTINSNNIMVTINNISSRAKRYYLRVSNFKVVGRVPLALSMVWEAAEYQVLQAAIIKEMDVVARVWTAINNKTIIIWVQMVVVAACIILLIMHKLILTKNIAADLDSSLTISAQPCLLPLVVKNHQATRNMRAVTIR